MLFNEPKLLKFIATLYVLLWLALGFSALQRAEIAEMWVNSVIDVWNGWSFSALQRAEIAEMSTGNAHNAVAVVRFSALQRAEIAEMRDRTNAGLG